MAPNNTPDSAPYHPPGHGTFRPRAYCPNCGALVAEWHIDRTKDYNEWLWFGNNAAVNSRVALPRRPHVGRGIPKEALPLWGEHRLNVARVRELHLQPKTQTQITTEAKALAEQAYKLLTPSCRRVEINKAAELFESARFIFSLVYEGLGKQDEAAKYLADARRLALTRWWDDTMERQLRSTAKEWFSTHGKDDLQE